MKGSFSINIQRNGEVFEVEHQNTILLEGLKLLCENSVDNNTDSVVTHLFVGTSHGTITRLSTSMSSEPIISVPYTDYLTPTYDNKHEDVFLNKLVFRFVVDNSFELKQLATGALINGVNKYFSVANVRTVDDFDSGVHLLQNDIVTVTYNLYYLTRAQINNNYKYSENILWSLLRTNRNWALCGYKRRADIVTETLKTYWNTEFTTNIECTYQFNSVTSQTFCRTICSYTFPDGTNLSDPKFVNQIYLNYGLPIKVETGVNLSVNKNVSGNVLKITHSLELNGDTRNLRTYDYDNGIYIRSIKINSFKGEVKPSLQGGVVELTIQTNPYSYVRFLYGNSQITTTLGLTDKLGFYTASIPLREVFIPGETNFSRKFSCVVFNNEDTKLSDEIELSIPEHNIVPTIVEQSDWTGAKSTMLDFMYYRDTEHTIVIDPREDVVSTTDRLIKYKSSNDTITSSRKTISRINYIPGYFHIFETKPVQQKYRIGLSPSSAKVSNIDAFSVSGDILKATITISEI